TFFAGLPIALLIVVGGVGSAWGAVNVGLLMSLVPFLLAPVKALTKPLTLLPATLGVALGRSPDGLVGEIATNFEPLRSRRRLETVILAIVAGLGVVDLVGLVPFRFAAPLAIVTYLVGGRIADQMRLRESIGTTPEAGEEISPERIGI